MSPWPSPSTHPPSSTYESAFFITNTPTSSNPSISDPLHHHEAPTFPKPRAHSSSSSLIALPSHSISARGHSPSSSSSGLSSQPPLVHGFIYRNTKRIRSEGFIIALYAVVYAGYTFSKMRSWMMIDGYSYERVSWWWGVAYWGTLSALYFGKRIRDVGQGDWVRIWFR